MSDTNNYKFSKNDLAKVSENKKYIKVAFDNKKYSYFCDYDVTLGDIVFVQGKMNSQPGVVIGITTQLPVGTVASKTLSVEKAYNINDGTDNLDYSLIESIEVDNGCLKKLIFKSKDSCIEELDLPNSITKIGKEALYYLRLKKINIPDSVLEIEEGAFREQLDLKTIQLPCCLKKIGCDAFFFTGLEDICIPNSVEIIEFGAFSMSKISSITLPKSIKRIDSFAFRDCKELEEATILCDDVELGSDIFKGCEKLVKINCSNDIYKKMSPKIKFQTALYYLNNIQNFSTKESEKFIIYLKNQKKKMMYYLINNGDALIFNVFLNLDIVTYEICSAVINDSTRYNVEIIATLIEYMNSHFSFEDETKYYAKEINKNPLSVAELKKIWNYEKDKSNNITINNYKGSDTVVLVPESIGKVIVKKIGKEVFSPYAYKINNSNERKNIKTVILPNSINSIGTMAFSRCTGLTNIEIPNSVTSIGDGAFQECSRLTNLEIPKGVKRIGDEAFSNCTGLASVEIPNSVISIGNGAFQKCSGLTNMEISNGVKSLGDGVFSECSELTSIVIPNSVTNIGNSAFKKCTKLTNLQIPNGITIIDDYTFSECIGLANVIIPNSVTSIGKNAFSGCIELTSIEIPNCVTNIGDGAFNGCIKLANIKIPNNLTSIGDCAFFDCVELKSMVIPCNVISIGVMAFRNCVGLTNVKIPGSVTSIGDYAFYGCKDLIIHAPAGSFAEQYAKENNIKFIAE